MLHFTLGGDWLRGHAREMKLGFHTFVLRETTLYLYGRHRFLWAIELWW